MGSRAFSSAAPPAPYLLTGISCRAYCSHGLGLAQIGDSCPERLLGDSIPTPHRLLSNPDQLIAVALSTQTSDSISPPKQGTTPRITAPCCGHRSQRGGCHSSLLWPVATAMRLSQLLVVTSGHSKEIATAPCCGQWSQR